MFFGKELRQRFESVLGNLEERCTRLEDRLGAHLNPFIGEFYSTVYPDGCWHLFKESDIVENRRDELKIRCKASPVPFGLEDRICNIWVKKEDVAYYDSTRNVHGKDFAQARVDIYNRKIV